MRLLGAMILCLTATGASLAAMGAWGRYAGPSAPGSVVLTPRAGTDTTDCEVLGIGERVGDFVNRVVNGAGWQAHLVAILRQIDAIGDPFRLRGWRHDRRVLRACGFRCDDSHRFIVACVPLGIGGRPAMHADIPHWCADNLTNHLAVCGDLTSEQPSPAVLSVPADQVRTMRGALDRRMLRNNERHALWYEHRPVVHDLIMVVRAAVTPLGAFSHRRPTRYEALEKFASFHAACPFRAMARRCSGLTVSRAVRCAAESLRYPLRLASLDGLMPCGMRGARVGPRSHASWRSRAKRYRITASRARGVRLGYCHSTIATSCCASSGSANHSHRQIWPYCLASGATRNVEAGSIHLRHRLPVDRHTERTAGVVVIPCHQYDIGADGARAGGSQFAPHFGRELLRSRAAILLCIVSHALIISG